MGTPIVYEEPSPLGAALEGVGAYGQEQERRKEYEANLKLEAQAQQAQQANAAASLAETIRSDKATEGINEKTREDAISERYYASNQSAFEHEQSIIEDHWKTLATLYERHIEYLGRMKIDTAKIQQQYAAAQLRYSADMQRLSTMAADTKANNDTRIQSTSMQIQARLDEQYDQLQAGMGKEEYQAIEQASRATGATVDPNTGLPSDYDPYYTPQGGGNTTINYVVPPGFKNPQSPGGGGAVQPHQPSPATPSGPTSFKTYADKALAALNAGQLTPQQIMQQFVTSQLYQKLPPGERQLWVNGLAKVLNINTPEQ